MSTIEAVHYDWRLSCRCCCRLTSIRWISLWFFCLANDGIQMNETLIGNTDKVDLRFHHQD